jgi:hypothetical protein
MCENIRIDLFIVRLDFGVAYPSIYGLKPLLVIFQGVYCSKFYFL